MKFPIKHCKQGTAYSASQITRVQEHFLCSFTYNPEMVKCVHKKTEVTDEAMLRYQKLDTAYKIHSFSKWKICYSSCSVLLWDVAICYGKYYNLGN
jgi:hypothetical protein